MSGDQYLIVTAEGGPMNGHQLYGGPLKDGVLSIGRMIDADIALPVEESAVGLRHCRLQIRGGSVWLEPLPHQEVYVDDPANEPDRARRVLVAEQVLPSTVGVFRLIELGGLARSPTRSSSAFTQTRLRVMISANPNPAVATPQATTARQNQRGATREIGLISTFLAMLVAVLVGVGGLGVLVGPPAFAAVMKQFNYLIVATRDMQRMLGDVERSSDGIITAIGQQHVQTVELLNGLPEKLSQPVPSYYETVRPSIWLVGQVAADSSFHGVGTAWVVAGEQGGRKSLITNRHVVNILLENWGEGAPAIRRYAESGGLEQKLLDPGALHGASFSHPHFTRLKELAQTEAKGRTVVNVADIARLVLLDPSQDRELGPGVAVASADELLALKEADRIGYVGFPFENLGAGAPSVEEPKPMFIAGAISRVSGPLNAVGEKRDQQLLMVDVVATGGASGSPVFDPEGRVIGVIAGGDVVHLDASVLQGDRSRLADPNKEKLRLPVGFTYAIRADVVSEFISGTVDQSRPDRWQSVLGLIGDHAREEDAKFTEWRSMNCGDVEPLYTRLSGDTKIAENGLFERSLPAADDAKTSYYFSAQTLSGGRLGAMQILVGPEDALEPASELAELQLSRARLVGKEKDARLVLSGSPGAVVVVDQYACPRSDGAAASR